MRLHSNYVHVYHTILYPQYHFDSHVKYTKHCIKIADMLVSPDSQLLVCHT